MGARNAIMCFVLILVLFPDNGSAGCWVSANGGPLCTGFLCKATCLIAEKMFNCVLKEHSCDGPPLNSECYCYLCDK
ncbi:hypothetical protein ZWY2020_032390 [Hordeum vulgare]|uniref:Knottin scorpion toxin-like domain-containing protein n=1 Tax=Hordeum vulgare subsp. vulgare TaxID=112509 RepID=A0A8I7B972_HORVV|nr:hypothetical protein ZWY2020_032390 [Hordeum vulgare]